MSRHEERIEASCMRRAFANRSESECPDDAFERYILMMCDRPILPHHITELHERPGARAADRSRTS